MPTLRLVDLGTWVNTLSTGRIARWGGSVVNFHRKAGFPDFSTIIEDTGIGDAFTTLDLANISAAAALYGRAAQGDDDDLYLAQEDQVDLFRVDIDGTLTDIGNRTGSGGTWLSTHAGHPTKVITSHSQTTGSRITSYSKPSGGAGTDIVTSAANRMFETIEVDPATGDIYASTFVTGSSRGVRKYLDDGSLEWDIDLTNAVADGVQAVNGLALLPQGLIAYTVDVDKPGGVRVNNNWWLIDPATGDFDLLDVTVGGVDFATWAEIGVNEFTGQIGCLTVLNDRVYITANAGIVWGGGFGGARWWAGVAGWS